MKKRDKIKPCACCGVSTSKIGEHFFLRSEIWYRVHPSERGFLCVGCVETKLGRLLTKQDFTDCTINKPQRGVHMSLRLVQRLQG